VVIYVVQSPHFSALFRGDRHLFQGAVYDKMKLNKVIKTELAELAVIQLKKEECPLVTEVLENELFFTLDNSVIIEDIGIEEGVRLNALRNMVHYDHENELLYFPIVQDVIEEFVNFVAQFKKDVSHVNYGGANKVNDYYLLQGIYNFFNDVLLCQEVCVTR